VPAHWHALWRRTCAQLQALEASGAAVFAHAYARLGHEVGVVQRLMQDARICWGFFFDHSPVEPHCNSCVACCVCCVCDSHGLRHPNNFVVVADTLAAGGAEGPSVPSVGSVAPQLLAPVDFDMCFREHEFLSPYSSAPDAELFQNWLETEPFEMQRALGGDNANTGVALGARAAHTTDEATAVDTLRWALRDTLLVGYREGYAAAVPARVVDGQLECGVVLVMRLAMMLAEKWQS
jgi:hypothetical protein